LLVGIPFHKRAAACVCAACHNGAAVAKEASLLRVGALLAALNCCRRTGDQAATLRNRRSSVGPDGQTDRAADGGAFPERKRLGALWDVESADQFAAAEREAKTRQLELRAIRMENPPYDFVTAFRTLAQNGVQMLIVLSSPLFGVQRPEITKLASEYRLPSMFILKAYVEEGGLMSYGVDLVPLARRAGSLIAKVLRGAKPADLPVEQAVNFEFAVNLKTARAIGVTLPTSTLLRADRVIE
jgi:ABC transporter substrate binding protein